MEHQDATGEGGVNACDLEHEVTRGSGLLELSRSEGSEWGEDLIVNYSLSG